MLLVVKTIIVALNSQPNNFKYQRFNYMLDDCKLTEITVNLACEKDKPSPDRNVAIQFTIKLIMPEV